MPVKCQPLLATAGEATLNGRPDNGLRRKAARPQPDAGLRRTLVGDTDNFRAYAGHISDTFCPTLKASQALVKTRQLPGIFPAIACCMLFQRFELPHLNWHNKATSAAFRDGKPTHVPIGELTIIDASMVSLEALEVAGCRCKAYCCY